MKHLSNFLRFGVVLLTSLTMLSGCGGGGGGGSGSNPPPSGVVVTVSDKYGVRVAGATVAIVGTTESTTTNAQGVAALTLAAGSRVSVKVSRPSFLDKTIDNVSIENGTFTQESVMLVRETSAAGGSLTSRGASPTVSVSDDKKSMTFEIELVVVDGDSNPIKDLVAEDFFLQTCSDLTIGKVDCVSGTVDVAYIPTNSGRPIAVEVVDVEKIDGVPVVVPYAAALMLDQSGSIYDSDPTGARLYSAKAFLDQLGNDDWVLLSAFAGDVTAKILNKPLTVYPSFRSKWTLLGDPSYFSTLDSLASLVGGNTPLYTALNTLVTGITDVADATIPNKAKSVVIFTDGDATDCPAEGKTCQQIRDESIQLAKDKQVRIFTIGLSSSVNFEALGELANQTRGAFLYAENVKQLIPLYGSVGKLLSLSLPTYRLTFTVNTADSAGFQPGKALFGRVDVTVPSNPPFMVPFIVGIPST